MRSLVTNATTASAGSAIAETRPAVGMEVCLSNSEISGDLTTEALIGAGHVNTNDER